MPTIYSAEDAYFIIIRNLSIRQNRQNSEGLDCLDRITAP